MAKTLLIFDCDGVLVDSEVISMRVEQEKLAELGLTMSVEEIAERFVGISIKSVGQILENEFGINVPEGFLDETQAETLRRFEGELQPVDGIREAVEAMGLPACVASSSQPHRIRKSLTLTGLIDIFEPNLFSATMVEHGKPAPDLFLLAARRMETEPANCTVIEDSIAGIEAAKAAGMKVAGFSGGSHADNEPYRKRLLAAGPDAHFSDMRQLPDILARLDAA